MNLRGSYRALLKNSNAAMLAAIEIYNKPQIAYREECFTILLVNAWELLAKAILSKNKQRIYYSKAKKMPYRTVSLSDALRKAKPYFPAEIPYEPVVKNLEVIVKYRDNSIHFYNQTGFGVVIYGLAQTSIINYRDMVLSIFETDIADQMTISLLPLGFGTSPDPIEFLRGVNTDRPRNKMVSQFIQDIVEATSNLEEQNLDTGRFLAKFNVSLQSVKNISSADIVAGIDAASTGGGKPIIVQRIRDPNTSHPLKRSAILANIGDELKGIKFSTYTIDAIIFKYDCKDNTRYLWKSLGGGAFQFSHDFLGLIKGLSKTEIEAALADYKEHRAEMRRIGKARRK